MDLFPKSNKDIFKRRIFVKTSDFDLLETPSMKWRLSKWESATRHAGDNDTALEQEMVQTLDQVYSFLHRLEVLVMVHSKRRSSGVWIKDWSKYQAMDRELKDQVVLGHKLMERVRELLELEDVGVRLSRSFQSFSNKSSYSGEGVYIQESEDTINSSSTSTRGPRYSSELRDVLRKFNQILKNKESLLPPQIQEIEMTFENKESILVGNKRDGLQFLTERLAMDNVQPIFITQPKKPSESTCSISCRVFNFTVDGSASEKSAAKKAAAVKMLERLVNDGLQKKLPPQIAPFTDYEMKEAVGILCESVCYDDVLTGLCEERRKPVPRYEVDSISKHSVRVRCSALGLQGYGNYANSITARRAAAREVLLQFRQKPKYL